MPNTSRTVILEPDSEPFPNRLWWLSRLTVPMLLFGFVIFDFGFTLLQYAARSAEIQRLIQPGMTEAEVREALATGPYVIGVASDAHYVEVKTRRPLLARAGISIGQMLGLLDKKFARLLPLEQCLVKVDTDGTVMTGDFFENWWW